MKEELKPCPLCGGEADLTLKGNDHTKKRSVTIKCKKCSVTLTVGAMRFSHNWCEETSIKKWNTRPPAGDATITIEARKIAADMMQPALKCWKEKVAAKTAECEGLRKDFLSAVDGITDANATIQSQSKTIAEMEKEAFDVRTAKIVLESKLTANQNEYFAKLKAKDEVVLHFKPTIKKYEEALERYGRHYRDCPQELGESRGECTCGFTSAPDKCGEEKEVNDE